MASRNINRNVRGQIVSYPLQGEGESYGEVFFIEKKMEHKQSQPDIKDWILKTMLTQK